MPEYEVCYDDDTCHWVINRNGRRWSPYLYTSEWEAIADCPPSARAVLERLHSSVE
jgi:hypothetical protein